MHADQTHHRLSRRGRRTRRQRHAVPEPARRRRSRRTGGSPTAQRAQMKLCCSTSPPRTKNAPRCSKPSAAPRARLFVPFTVGGGVRTLDDAAAIFDAGADKISINSAAIADPSLITQIAQRFGSQAVIVAIDAKRNGTASLRSVRLMAGATPRAKMPSSGRRKPKSAARAKFCSPPWTATAPAWALTAN